MTTENTTAPIVAPAPRGPLTDEQKAARARVAQQNIAALAPFIKEAQGIIAKRKNIANPEAMDSLMEIKQIAAEVHAVARELKDKSEGKVKGTRAPSTGTPKWLGKLTLQLQKAFGFAKKHKISDAKIVECLEFGMANPIEATPKKAKETSVAPSGVAGAAIV